MLILVCFTANFSHAQDKETSSYSIYMISRAAGDSIMLRWAPANYESWQLGNTNGYIIERYTILKDNNSYPDRTPVQLNATPVKPISVDDWEKMAETDNYAGVAAQAIYGESFDVEAGNDSPALAVFNKATEQQNRYSFALFAADNSARVARGMGLMYTDKNIVKGEKYLYVVYFGGNTEGLADTAYTFIGPDDIVPLGKPSITQTVTEDKLVTLEWMAPSGRAGYTAFDIQRSGDNGKTFSNRNTSPLINTSEEGDLSEYHFFIDTLPENDLKFVYRVRGISPFGEKGPWSDTASATGRETVSEMPAVISHQSLADRVYLEWEFNKKSEKLIRGFQVVRSTVSNRGFEPVSEVLGVKERTFYDLSPIPTAYYKVQALDRYNGIVSSFPVLVQSIDSIPPVAPTGLMASVDTTGKVFLSWKGNPDEDIYGYRIYRANARHEEFSQVTIRPVADSFYLDQVELKTLSRKVYYRVMAIDKRQNYSAFSEILEVTRPDVIPPATPVIQNISSSEKGICLEWVPSSSTDVISQVVLRKDAEGSNWKEIYLIGDTVTSFCDTLAVTGKVYDYTLAAYDESGLKSEIQQVFSGKKLQSAQGIVLSYKIRRGKSAVELSWQPAAADAKYILYRAKGDAPLMTYTSIGQADGNYTDTKITPDTTYRYVIKCITNGKIALSNEVVVNY